MHYELDFVDWLLLLQKSFQITIPSGFGKELRNLFSKIEYLAFEEELTKNGIEFSKIAFTKYMSQ